MRLSAPHYVISYSSCSSRYGNEPDADSSSHVPVTSPFNRAVPDEKFGRISVGEYKMKAGIPLSSDIKSQKLKGLSTLGTWGRWGPPHPGTAVAFNAFSST